MQTTGFSRIAMVGLGLILVANAPLVAQEADAEKAPPPRAGIIDLLKLQPAQKVADESASDEKKAPDEAKPAEKPDEAKPAEQPVEAKPAEPPADAKPAEKPDEATPAEQPAEPPAEAKPAEAKPAAAEPPAAEATAATPPAVKAADLEQLKALLGGRKVEAVRGAQAVRVRAPEAPAAGAEAVGALVEVTSSDVDVVAPDAATVDAVATPAVPAPKREPLPPMFHMRDGTRLAGFPETARLRVETAYGSLVVPIGEVVRVRFAAALDNDLGARIEKLVEQLGNEEFDLREQASEELVEIGVAALPALRKGLESDDEEVKSRAEKLVAQLEEEIDEPEEEELHLTPLEGDEDEVETLQFTIKGQVEEASFQV